MATAQRSTQARRSAGSRSSTSARGTRETGSAKQTGTARTPAKKSTSAAARSRARAATGPKATTAKRTSGGSGKQAGASRAVPFTDGSSIVRRTSVTVPVVNMRIPLLSPRVPNPGAMAAQTKWAAQAVGANLPPATPLLYYGGLGLLAVAGAVEWPVAAAIGVGVWLAGRTTDRRGGQAVAA